MLRVSGMAAAALLTAFSGSMWADGNARVTVQVKSVYDKPVENAEVILDFLGSHQVTRLGKRKPIHWEMRTNQDGVAHFPPVPEGTIKLQVNAKSYQTFGKKFDVDSDHQSIDIQLNPPQPQYSAHPPLKQ